MSLSHNSETVRMIAYSPCSQITSFLNSKFSVIWNIHISSQNSVIPIKRKRYFKIYFIHPRGLYDSVLKLVYNIQFGYEVMSHHITFLFFYKIYYLVYLIAQGEEHRLKNFWEQVPKADIWEQEGWEWGMDKS